MPTADAVLVDRIQIQQVLINLIRNAVEAMHRSQRRRIDIRSIGDDSDLVTVIVADSGPGLAPEMVKTLFQPFRSSKDKRHGAGPVDQPFDHRSAWRPHLGGACRNRRRRLPFLRCRAPLRTERDAEADD